MIDWLAVAASSLWIFGLAELLAVFSTAYWISGAQREPLRRVLGRPSFRFATAIGIILFALGMSLTVEAWWEKGGWAAVIVLAFWESVAAWRDQRAPGR